MTVLAASMAAANIVPAERIVWPGEHMNLDGTRRGPHYVYMTREERTRQIEHFRNDPKGRKEFEDIQKRANGTLDGEVEEKKALVLAYLVTKDRKYFDAWRRRWLAEANRLNTLFPTAMDLAKDYGPRNFFIWGNPGMAWDYDRLAEHLDDREERLFRWQLKRYCDALRIWKVDRKNVTGQGEGTNMAARTISLTSPQWYAIGYDECIQWALTHEPAEDGRDGAGGLVQWMRPMRDKRVWGEAPIYQWYVGEGIMYLAERAWRYDGTDAWNLEAPSGTRPRHVVDGAVDMSFPLERTGVGLGSIRIANFGEEGTSLFQDQWLNYGGGGRACWEPVLRSVYQASKDKGYGWLASVNRGVGDPSSALPIDPAAVAPPPAPCSVWPTAGIAMVRADESPEYWLGRTLALHVMGGERRRSAPGDSFSIRLHGAGRLLYPDWIMTYYEVYNDVGWQRAGMRRSSVMIDGRETSTHRTRWRHAFWPEVKYLSLHASRYGHDRSERAFMMTREYLLDIVDMVVEDQISPDLHYYPRAGERKQYRGWSRAGLWDENGALPESHTFDYILHGIGQQFTSHWWRFTPSSEMTTENWPNRWFENERRADMGSDSFHVDWVQRSGGLERRLGVYKDLAPEWFQDQAGVRLHIIGAPDTVVYALQAPMGEGGHHTERERPNPSTHVVDPDQHPEMTIKTTIVRRRGKAAQFATVHEPYRDRPRITQLEYLHRPEKTDDPRTVGIKITGPDYVDRLYLTLGLPGYTGDDGVQDVPVAPEAEAPVVTVAAKGDPVEQVTFAGCAYIRCSGEIILVRGDVRGLCVYAPEVTAAMLNGAPVAVQRAHGYVYLGTAEPPADVVFQPAAPTPVALKIPVDITLPQRLVNIDAARGGWMVVRVTNRTDNPTAGTVTVEPAPGLTASPAKTFTALRREHRIDLGFALRPQALAADPIGRLVPVVVTVSAGGGSHSIKSQVAVGIVVREVPRTYHIPVYDFEGNLPGKPKPSAEWLTRVFDYIQVRAPGYTLRVDTFSGGSRWVMDCTGLIRTSLAAYPYGMTRVDDSRYRRRETLSGGWLKEAKYLGLSKTDDRHPTLEFTSLDGKEKWRYVLMPETAGSAAFGAIDIPGVAAQNGLGFKVPEEPWWREAPVSIWPDYQADPVEAEDQERPDLLAGMMPTYHIPDEVTAVNGVFWDEKYTVNGLPSLCFDLDKLRGIGVKKYRLTLDWPVEIRYNQHYRFAFKMRHENVTNLVTYEPMYTNWASTGLGNWVSKEANDSIYWPARVREWFLCQNRVARAVNTRNMHLEILVPGDPEQTGKIWLGGFSVREER